MENLNTVHEVKKFFEAKRTEIYNRHSVFFAFSQEQFSEQEKDGVQYVRWHSGGFVPKDNYDEFSKELDVHFDEESKLLGSEKFRRKYIAYELANHECYYTGDVDDAFRVVRSSDITLDEVIKVYREELPKQEF